MKYFKAVVLKQGKKQEFGFYANDKKEANKIAKVKFNGIIIKINEAEEPFDIKIKRLKEEFFGNLKKKKIKQDALIAAIRQLAVMTNAGISINDSLQEIANSTQDENLQKIFSNRLLNAYIV